jgi:hypothetical protein
VALASVAATSLIVVAARYVRLDDLRVLTRRPV